MWGFVGVGFRVFDMEEYRWRFGIVAVIVCDI